MPVKWIAVLPLLFALASCYPDKECSGELVFDETMALCFSCPAGAKYKNDTCECMAGYEFIGLRCVLMEGAVPATPDAGDSSASDGGTDAAAYEGAGCKDYCSFATTCIGGNAYAGALPTLVMGLHADNAGECESGCKSDLGSTEATDPALACLVAGKDAVMCDDPNPQTGLEKSFGLLGQCCAPNLSSELCKSICAALKADPNTKNTIKFCG
jgi:hypothetical protein